MTPSSKNPVRNYQRPPSMTLMTGGSWFTLIMLESWNLAQRQRITYHDDIWCQGCSHPPRLQSGTINIFLVWLGGLGVLDSRIFMLFGTQVKNNISRWFMMSSMTSSSKTPVRNHQHPLSMTLNTGGIWYTSNHARELKFSTQVKNHTSWWYMMSRMCPSSGIIL